MDDATREELRELAIFFAQQPGEATRQALGKRLATVGLEGQAGLEELAAELAPYPEAASVLLEQVLELVGGGDAGLMVRLGQLAWAMGEDDAAQGWLGRATTAEGATARVMGLEAQITRDRELRRKLLAKILMLEPQNREAWERVLAHR